MGSASEARLHTATSSGDVYSTISVQRLEQRMVPRFCWLDFLLHASLNSMYGVPVSVLQDKTTKIEAQRNELVADLSIQHGLPDFAGLDDLAVLAGRLVLAVELVECVAVAVR